MHIFLTNIFKKSKEDRTECREQTLVYYEQKPSDLQIVGFIRLNCIVSLQNVQQGYKIFNLLNLIAIDLILCLNICTKFGPRALFVKHRIM